MGFGSLATYVILFTVGLSMVAGFILTFRDFFAKSSLSLEERQEITRNKILSGIEIINYTYNETQDEKNKTWEYEDDFNEGIFENTTASDPTYPDALVLAHSSTTGQWYSEILELDGEINFTEIESTGTMIEPLISYLEIRIRTAENRTSLTSTFLGPDGTEASYYSLNSVENINDIHNGDSVVQLEVSMGRNSEFVETPVLDYVSIGYKYTNVLNLVIRNDGKVRLDNDVLDFFINTDRLERNTIVESEVIDDGYKINPGFWDPGRDINVKISKAIESEDFMLTAITEFGTKDTKKVQI